ncbi:MAG TPA: tetratricopeptide repeat protein, partial [Anaerolineales bacterium]|nr:tetratricopeptide repeat protein [Anaerolineales bacterium]
QAEDLLDGEGWKALAAAYLDTGEKDLGAQALSRALELGGQDPATLGQLIALQIEQGDYLAAAELLGALVELPQVDIVALKRHALILAAVNPEEAVPLLSRLEAEIPEEAAIFREIGLSIRRARAASPVPEYVSLAAGRALGAAGEWEMARLALERAVELNPGYAEAWAYLGEALEQLGLDGRGELDLAYSLDPASLGVNLLYALYFQRYGDTGSALMHLEKARNADPENPTLLAEMASIVAASGDIEGAISLFEQAIDLAPEESLYWKILANFSIQNETQILEVGLPAARQATLIDPGDPEAFDLLGQAYFALANPALAERFLRQSAGLDPDYAPAAFHLGVLYLTTGLLSPAREQLERAISLAPDSALADLAGQLLQDYFR